MRTRRPHRRCRCNRRRGRREELRLRRGCGNIRHMVTGRHNGPYRCALAGGSLRAARVLPARRGRLRVIRTARLAHHRGHRRGNKQNRSNESPQATQHVERLDYLNWRRRESLQVYPKGTNLVVVESTDNRRPAGRPMTPTRRTARGNCIERPSNLQPERTDTWVLG